MIVDLKEFGTSLGSRVLGKEVSSLIDFGKEDEIILDFQDVKMVTSSFADEVIGKNCAKLVHESIKFEFETFASVTSASVLKEVDAIVENAKNLVNAIEIFTNKKGIY